MRLDQANLLLDHRYLPLENGWLRLEDGQAHVAARTHMIGCTGAMVAWWFGFIHHTEQYLWWHPRDHVFSDWDGERGTGRFVGGTHLVHELIGGELVKLKINFREPGTILDVSRFANAGVSAVAYGRIGELGTDSWFGHLLHLLQDTPEGCVMRSRFWLGALDPLPAGIDRRGVEAAAPDWLASGLQRHASEEMAILGGFLPTVYRIHNPHQPAV